LSAKIEPVATEEFDDDVIREYDLPEDEDSPLFWVDTSADGYTAEWLVDFGVEEFEEFLRQQMCPEDKDAIATIEPEPENGYKIREPFEDVLDHEDYHSDDCSYFQVQTDNFDIGWEDWDNDYRLILTVPNDDTEPLEKFLYNSFELSGNISDSQKSAIDTGVSQANQVTSRDYRREG
jgi:hypothetical protein